MAGDPRPRTGALRLVLSLLRLNFQGAMEYRISFLMGVVFMMLNNVVYMVFWWVFFERFERVGGYAFREMILLFSVAAAAFGIAHVVFGNLGRLSQAIAEGHLDAVLAQPKDPLLRILAARTSPASLGDFLFGCTCFLIWGDPTPARVALFLGVSALGAGTLVAFGVMSHSLAFWLGASEGLSRTLGEAILTFALYPEVLFSGGVRLVLYTVVPAAFVSYVPARVLADPDPASVGLLLGVVLTLLLAARAVFARGLRRYESGNQMVANV